MHRSPQAVQPTADRIATPQYPLPAGQAGLDLLVWDAPNIDATLAQVIGAKPTAANRPRYDAIARWLVQWADEAAGRDQVADDGGSTDPRARDDWDDDLGHDEDDLDDSDGDLDGSSGVTSAPSATAHEVEAAVFANVPPMMAGQMRGWVEAVRSLGFAVFARPKLVDGDDVDLDMLAHVQHRAASGRLRRLVVASGDGRNFLAPLEQLARSGVDVTVLSFFEVAGYAAESPLIRFIDLEEVPGAFLQPLDRTRLDTLPVTGAWLRPTRTLRDIARDA